MVCVDVIRWSVLNDVSDSRPRGVIIGRHFHANIKVQIAMCKDNNSKSRAATYVKFDMYIYNDIDRLYSVYKIFDF